MYEQQQNSQEGGGGALSIYRLLSAVRRRLKIVIALPIIAAILAALFAITLPNQFDASAVVQIDPRKKSISNLEGVLSELQPDAATVESEVEIIRSRLITLKVIDIFELAAGPGVLAPAAVGAGPHLFRRDRA